MNNYMRFAVWYKKSLAIVKIIKCCNASGFAPPAPTLPGPSLLGSPVTVFVEGNLCAGLTNSVIY